MATPDRLKFWVTATSSPRHVRTFADRYESGGWDGIAVTDSQNIAGDAWVALGAMALATSRVELGTSVTNPITRHPAVTAAAAMSVAVLSGRRVSLGIGRGDSALAHLGKAPAPVTLLERYVRAVRTYASGEGVAFDELGFSEASAADVSTLALHDTPESSRLTWHRGDAPGVDVEVAASGPKVIAAAARSADRVLFAVGADLDRLKWGIATARRAREEVGLDPEGIEFGAFLSVVPHPSVEVARRLASGGLATLARFSVMHGTVTGPTRVDQRAALERLHTRYDMKHHGRAGSEQTSALPDEFVDDYAVVGPADSCIARLREVQQLGIGKVYVIGASFGSRPEEALESSAEMVDAVLPAFRVDGPVREPLA